MAAPAPGTRIPDFTLKAASKDAVADFKLSDHLGKGPLVFGFFPLAFTGVCTKEMCDFRDNLGSLAALDAQVFGFSTDTAFANKAFAAQENLSFAIISDPNREFIGKHWPMMPTQVGGVTGVAKRGVLILNPDGTVQWSSVSDDVKVWVGTDEVRKQLAMAVITA